MSQQLHLSNDQKRQEMMEIINKGKVSHVAHLPLGRSIRWLYDPESGIVIINSLIWPDLLNSHLQER